MIRRYWNIHLNEMIEEKFYTVDNIACMTPNAASVIENTKDASHQGFISPEFSFVYNHYVRMEKFTTVHFSSFTFWKMNAHPKCTLHSIMFICLRFFGDKVDRRLKYQIGIRVWLWGRHIYDTSTYIASVREWREPSDIPVHGVI